MDHKLHCLSEAELKSQGLLSPRRHNAQSPRGTATLTRSVLCCGLFLTQLQMNNLVLYNNDALHIPETSATP